MIAKAENLKVDEKILYAIYDTSEGDMRRATNLFQAVSSLEEVDDKRIYEMTSQAPPNEVMKVMEFALESKIVESRELLFGLMLKYGLSGVDMLKQMQRQIWNLKLLDNKKMVMIDKIGEYEFRMVEGSDESIQLEALLAQFALVGEKN
jgi:replication factor C small subunit